MNEIAQIWFAAETKTLYIMGNSRSHLNGTPNGNASSNHQKVKPKMDALQQPSNDDDHVQKKAKTPPLRTVISDQPPNKQQPPKSQQPPKEEQSPPLMAEQITSNDFNQMMDEIGNEIDSDYAVSSPSAVSEDECESPLFVPTIKSIKDEFQYIRYRPNEHIQTPKY